MKEKIMALVIAAAEQVDEDHRVSSEGELNADTRLFGAGSLLDSLGLVTLIVELEQAIQEQMNVIVSLADEKALSQERSPFRTIGTLAEYAAEQIAEYSNG
jgi:D-alanine--poly(phosphoribitol) ligase subunit 2